MLLISGRLPADLAYLLPAIIVLVILGDPAVLSATYAGIQNVDPAARDAAKGMGMTGRQVLWRVEVPNALPLIFSGVRSSMLQIVATATIAAYVSLGGLGRFIIDGQAQQDYPQMAAGRGARRPAGDRARPARRRRPAAGRLAAASPAASAPRVRAGGRYDLLAPGGVRGPRRTQ